MEHRIFFISLMKEYRIFSVLTLLEYMKKIITVILLVLLTLQAHSQIQNRKVYLNSTQEAILYKVDDEPVLQSGDSSHRVAVNLEVKRKKNLYKSKRLQIVGVANSTVQAHYDTYIVKFRNKLYYLPKQFVLDNSYIDSVNRKLEDRYSQLVKRIDSLDFEYRFTASLYKKICEDKVSYFSSQKQELSDAIDSIKQSMHAKFTQERDSLFKIEYDQWRRKLPASTKKALQYIEITRAWLSQPDDEGGCDYSLYYVNKSKKL